jgi:hypothetical protein
VVLLACLLTVPGTTQCWLPAMRHSLLAALAVVGGAGWCQLTWTSNAVVPVPQRGVSNCRPLSQLRFWPTLAAVGLGFSWLVLQVVCACTAAVVGCSWDVVVAGNRWAERESRLSSLRQLTR